MRLLEEQATQVAAAATELLRLSGRAPSFAPDCLPVCNLSLSLHIYICIFLSLSIYIYIYMYVCIYV